MMMTCAPHMMTSMIQNSFDLVTFSNTLSSSLILRELNMLKSATGACAIPPFIIPIHTWHQINTLNTTELV